MADRFILLNEKIMDWEWYNDLYTYKFFTSALLLASYKDTSYQGINIKRGSFITSIPSLSEKMHLSETCIRNCIKKLVSTGEIIDTVLPNRCRIITIVNYDKYQSDTAKHDKGVRSKQGNKQSSKESSKYPFNKYIDTPKGVSIYDGEKKSSSACRSDNGSLDDTAVNFQTLYEFAGSDRLAEMEIFCDAFVTSGTALPSEWKEIFDRFSNAEPVKQQEFIDRLLTGFYKEKWGETK